MVRATTSDPPHGPEVGGERAIDHGLRWGVATLWVRRGACPMPSGALGGHRAAQRSYPEGGYAPPEAVIYRSLAAHFGPMGRVACGGGHHGATRA